MRAKPVRVLCVDSSDARREKLTAAFESFGVEVWAARDLRDALPLVAGLSPDALIVDEASTRRREPEWDQLIAQDLKLPALVHTVSTGNWPRLSGDFGVVRTENPEVIVAIVSLLLGSKDESSATKLSATCS